MLVVLAATIVVNVALSPFYWGGGNFVNLFWLSTEKIIVVVAMTFVIINGEIDLSVASVMGFSAAVLASLHAGGSVPFWLAIVIALVAAGLAGLVQGVVITRFGLPSLVVTLAGLIGFRGAARVLLEDRSVGEFPEWFDSLGQQTLVGPLPVALVIFVVGLAVAWITLRPRCIRAQGLRQRGRRRRRPLLGHRGLVAQAPPLHHLLAGRRVGRDPLRRPARDGAGRPGARSSSWTSSPWSCSAG